MEQTMEVTNTTEVAVVDPIKATAPDISLDPKDFQQEINKIAAENGQKIENGNVVSIDAVSTTEAPEAAVQPEVRPQATAQPVEVPEKFQTKDGQVDLQKVEKSTVNADEAIRKFLDKEKELRKLQNSVHKLEQTVQPSVQSTQSVVPNQITADQINEALRQSNNPGKVLLDLSAIVLENAKNQALAEARQEIDGIKNRVESDQRTRELQAIAANDPWVFSPEGFKTLSEIRDAKPWLNAAPEPWAAAYDSYLADRVKSEKSNSQVSMPNPTGSTVRAPATPVNPVSRTSPKTNLAVLEKDQNKLNAWLDTLTPAQQTAYWQARLGPRAK